MPTKRIQTVTANGFSSSASSAWHENFTVATPTRHFAGTGKYLKCELYGKQYPDSDAAFAAMTERGYCEVYYPRSSVVIPVFAKLEHCQLQAKFDALYRLFKHKLKHGQRNLALQGTLKRMAAKVSIFHPCTKQFNTPTP